MIRAVLMIAGTLALALPMVGQNSGIILIPNAEQCPNGYHWHDPNTAYLTNPPIIGDGQCHSNKDDSPAPGAKLESKPEPIDVPAVPEKRVPTRKLNIGEIFVSATDLCPDKKSGLVKGKDGHWDECLFPANCDPWPERYLLGPNGNGEFICHRAQLEAK